MPSMRLAPRKNVRRIENSPSACVMSPKVIQPAAFFICLMRRLVNKETVLLAIGAACRLAAEVEEILLEFRCARAIP